MSKTALVCGISGQDGSYLAKLLVDRGYRVIGTSRDVEGGHFSNLDRMGLRDRVTLMSMEPTDFRSVHATFSNAKPDEVYALAGQSSVGLSFEVPAQTLQSIVFGTLNLLEAVRLLAPHARLYHASSSECFGDLGHNPATENTPFDPKSPYGVAKASAHMLVRNYREAYDLYAVNGQLFNHESPLRPKRFVTQKIAAGAARIARGADERLRLGAIDVSRDWGWAPEYVEAMWAMLQQEEPEDFIIATGKSVTLESFAAAAFAAVDLDWRDHVEFDNSLRRPSEIAWSSGDPGKAKAKLGWEARTKMPDVAQRMVEAIISQSE